MMRRTHLPLLALFLVGFCATRPRAQFVVDRIEGVPWASVHLRAAPPYAISQPSHAYLLLEWLDSLLPQRRPDQVRSRERSESHVRLGFTSTRAEVETFVDRVVAARLSGIDLDDAALLRLRDRALLRADDESMVLPGPRLRARVYGIPVPHRAELKMLADQSVKELRDVLRACLDALQFDVVVLGDVDPTRWDRDFYEGKGILRSPGNRTRIGDPLASSEIDERVSAPYVIRSTQLKGGGAETFEPFTWAALTWIEFEARRRFPMRGRELEAEAPVFDWDPGTGRLFLIRRGTVVGLGEETPPDPDTEFDAFFSDLERRRFTPGSFDSVWRSVRLRMQPETRDLQIASLFHDHARRRLLGGSGDRLELPRAGWGELPKAEFQQRVEDRVAELIGQDWARARLDPPPSGDS